MQDFSDSARFEPGLPARRPLRIAVVSETFPPEINGVASTAARVVDGLRARGHRLCLVRPRQDGDATATPDPDPNFNEVLVRGLPIPGYPQLKMGLPAGRALSRLWQQQPPDVVHIVTEGPLGWSALQAARRLRLPVVSDFRTNFHSYSAHYGLPWLTRPIMGYLRGFHNRAACTMVPTETLRSQLAAQGFERLAVVSRGVDTHLFHPGMRSAALRARWGALDRTLVVLCVGRLAPEKNLGLLLDAYEQLGQPGRMPVLVLVGDGPATEQLRARCPRAVFAGVQRGEALAEHFASADLFLFPSLTETFGNVVPEAMASGLPVLGFDYAAAGELIRHGVNGLLAPLGDGTAWLAEARRIAADREAMGRIGKSARQTALRLDWAGIVGQVEARYAAALHETALPATRLRQTSQRSGAPAA